ncbi:MAG: hypothetical protein JEZ06_09570 [Anaerolineaceae bacterium]|nr:hypothetical protein [Anaerolineaceae bacterium]
MKFSKVLVFSGCSLLVLAMLLTGCQTLEAGVVEGVTEAEEVENKSSTNLEPALEIVGFDETLSLSMDELIALESTTGYGGTISSAGVITPPQVLKGITVTSLCDLVGGLEPGMGVSIVAKDGYAMTMSYEQIAEGNYITYDPGTGDENSIEGSLSTIVAFERDGEAISSDEDGPLRLFIIGDENNHIVDGHWTVKWVKKIILKPMSEEWSLNLEGAITELMDRNSFESCSAQGCHQATWKDENGDKWAGVPLYYLAGRMDDETRHEGRAYNDAFAKAGYILQLFAADGYNVGVDSSFSDFNRHIFVADTLNGEPLPEEYFPLRLVGEGLENSEMVGQITQIILQPNEGVAFPIDEVEESKPEIDLVLPEGAVLLIHGQVTNQLALGLENMEAMNVKDLETEHPKNGMQTYQGVLLNDLLNLAGADANATILVITASDGYASEADLSEVRNCEECLVAFGEDGSLNMVMTGMESIFWAKDIQYLEVK